MSLFHFHVTQVKRSAGQSAVACAAYRAGEKLYSEYYGETSDFTHKGGVVCSEIILPLHAPAEYKDRATLWNAVEKAERGKKAQLAYSFDIALQNELSLDENIALARQFVSEQLVGQGMIADFAIHQPDKEDGGISNPHFHVLCPIRPIEADGRWGQKQRRVYRLDESGNRILGEDGKPLFDAVSTTDWGDPATLEHWREVWAAMVNAKFEQKGLTCRIDHRSYERQGVDLFPTVHEGVAVRQMEAKGIATDKGDLNRWIKNANSFLRGIGKKIIGLADWLKAVKEELSKPQAPNLAELLGAYYTRRNAGAYSQKAKANNLKEFNELFNYLEAHGIYTLDDLESCISAASSAVDLLKEKLDGQTARMKQIRSLADNADTFKRLKPIYDGLQKIKFAKAREKYRAEHAADLKQFYAARRILQAEFPDGKVDTQKLSAEYGRLEQDHAAAYAEFKNIREDSQQLWRIKTSVDAVLRQREQTQSTERKNQHER